MLDYKFPNDLISGSGGVRSPRLGETGMAFHPQEQLPRPVGGGDPLPGSEKWRGVLHSGRLPSSGIGIQAHT